MFHPATVAIGFADMVVQSESIKKESITIHIHARYGWAKTLTKLANVSKQRVTD